MQEGTIKSGVTPVEKVSEDTSVTWAGRLPKDTADKRYLMDPYRMSEKSMAACGNELNIVLHCFKYRDDLKKLREFFNSRVGDEDELDKAGIELLNVYLNMGLPMPANEKEKVKMCKAIEDLKEEGRAEGRAEEREDAIQKMVMAFRSLGVSDDRIVAVLGSSYSLPLEVAQSYL